MANSSNKAINIVLGRYKNKKNFGKDIESEADQIFMKNYPQYADKSGNFKKLGSDDVGTPAYNDYQSVYKQVQSVRRKGKKDSSL